MRIIKFGGIVNMGKKLAIKGHSTRGKEVIELLEMLGGVNADSHKGNFPDEWKSSYYIYRDNTIQFGRDEFLLKLKFVIFTLEEFLEKYPYKVGDIVKTGKDEEGVIKQMRWVNNDIVYWVNSHKNCDWTQTLSVDVLDKYNRLKLNDIEYNMETKVESTGFMQLGKTFAVIFNDANYEDEVELQLGDYEIEVRNGKTYAVRKKSVFPKTYDENWKLVPNKFDISNLKAYDKVLVRDANVQLWVADLFSHVLDKPLGGYTFACVGHYSYQCIPYEGNEHLLGTNNDCDEYYKNW